MSHGHPSRHRSDKCSAPSADPHQEQEDSPNPRALAQKGGLCDKGGREGKELA